MAALSQMNSLPLGGAAQVKIQVFQPKSSPIRFQNNFEKSLLAQRCQCSREGPGSISTVWGRSPNIMPPLAWLSSHLCGSRSCRIPSPRGAEAQIKRLFPTLWIQQTGIVCSLFVNDLLMQQKQFWGYGKQD